MDDDFNTAGALGHLFDLVKAINTARDAGADAAALAQGQDTLRELAGVLGLQLEAPAPRSDQSAAPFVELLVTVRQELRQAKQYALADSIRKRLGDLGVTLEDTPGGTVWHMER